MSRKDTAARWRGGEESERRRKTGEVKERTAGSHQEERGAEATAWRAGPCVNGDVLNLC